MSTRTQATYSAVRRPPPHTADVGLRTVTYEHVAAVVAKRLESAPRGATHWSTRAMAKELGLSQSTISWVWRAFGLQGHRGPSTPNGAEVRRSPAPDDLE
jgi:hypothetical protein